VGKKQARMNVLELAWQKKTAEMQRTIPHDLIVLHQRPPPNVVLAWRCTPHTGASDSCLILDLQKTGPRNSPKTLFWHHVTLSSWEILGSWRAARYRGEDGRIFWTYSSALLEHKTPNGRGRTRCAYVTFSWEIQRILNGVAGS
jgi:hypothetical protein